MRLSWWVLFWVWPLIKILSQAINVCHVWDVGMWSKEHETPALYHSMVSDLIDKPFDTVGKCGEYGLNGGEPTQHKRNIFTFSVVCVQCEEKLFAIAYTKMISRKKKKKQIQLHSICVQIANQRKEKQTQVKTLSTVDTALEKFYLRCNVNK